MTEMMIIAMTMITRKGRMAWKKGSFPRKKPITTSGTVHKKFMRVHLPDPGNERSEFPDHGNIVGDDDRLRTVTFEELSRLLDMILVKKAGIPFLQEFQAEIAPRPVIHQVPGVRRQGCYCDQQERVQAAV